ncbi:MAG TPA: hypothetical protein VIM02_05660 [Rhizomicrobium sp.]
MRSLNRNELGQIDQLIETMTFTPAGFDAADQMIDAMMKAEQAKVDAHIHAEQDKQMHDAMDHAIDHAQADHAEADHAQADHAQADHAEADHAEADHGEGDHGDGGANFLDARTLAGPFRGNEDASLNSLLKRRARAIEATTR